MASVDDLWWRKVRQPNGTVRREKSARYGTGRRWQTRWREPDGSPKKRSFVNKIDAERLAATVEADKLRGTYLDVRAGAEVFSAYAGRWLARQTSDPLTRQNIDERLGRYVRSHALWSTPLNGIRPGTLQTWLGILDAQDGIGPSTIGVVFSHVSCILNAAVDDELIGKNPAKAASVKPPPVDDKKIVPWVREWIVGMHEELPDRYAITATLAAGLGLRQGEVFGLSPQDVDWLRGKVTVRRQVKIVGSKLVFALPKGRKIRDVPLAPSVREELAAYLVSFPAKEVTLPWERPDGDPVAVTLAMTTRESRAFNRNHFNQEVWRPAREKAGIPQDRVNGMHALRHWFASTLLDASESIMAVSSYLGHSSASITLKYYAHLMPSSESRTKAAIDAAWTAPCAPDVPQEAAVGSLPAEIPRTGGSERVETSASDLGAPSQVNHSVDTSGG